jgi:hypothetical protein
MPAAQFFFLSLSTSAFTLSRMAPGRSTVARSHPPKLVTITMTGPSQLQVDASLWYEEAVFSGPGLTIGGWPGYVQFYGANTLGPITHSMTDAPAGPWHRTVNFALMPQSIPCTLHRGFICGRLQIPGNYTVVKVPLNITVVDP